MTDESRFEARLARALREHADQAILPFDPNEIAGRAIDERVAPRPWMRLALVATFVVAALVVTGALAAQFLAGPVGIGGTQTIGAEELAAIVADSSNTPGRWDQTVNRTGGATATTPMRSTALADLDGFVDGRTTEMCGTGAADQPLGCLLAWAALFETVDQAERAYDLYLADFAAPDGWNVPPGSRSEAAGLGDEAVLYTNVRDPHQDGPPLDVFLWREANLVMAVVGVAEMDVDALRVVADDMQARAE